MSEHPHRLLSPAHGIGLLIDPTPPKVPGTHTVVVWCPSELTEYRSSPGEDPAEARAAALRGHAAGCRRCDLRVLWMGEDMRAVWDRERAN